MEQLKLFDLSKFRNNWVPLFEPDVMDKLAGIGGMCWREELKRRNNPHINYQWSRRKIDLKTLRPDILRE
jgi:hypothetical protein